MGIASSDFQGLWKERETCFWFSSVSIVRHFQGLDRSWSVITQPASLAGNHEIAFALLLAFDALLPCHSSLLQ